MKKNLLILSIIALAAIKAYPQAVGSWTDHLPYHKGTSVATDGEKIYVSNPYSLFYYYENTINRLSKVNGLSDIGISEIEYNTDYSTLIIAYNNSNIDLLKNNRIINLADIKRANVNGTNTINRIHCCNEKVYLACGFGIVVLDVNNEEFIDTYYIGEGGNSIWVNDITTNNDSIYAATDIGIFAASLSSNQLANYEEWSIIDSISNISLIEYLNNKIIINKAGTPTLTNDSVFYKENMQWTFLEENTSMTNTKDLRVDENRLIVSEYYGTRIYDEDLLLNGVIYSYGQGQSIPLISKTIYSKKLQAYLMADETRGLVQLKDGVYDITTPNGPFDINSYKIVSRDNTVWVSAGGHDDTWANVWNRKGLYKYSNHEWTSFNAGTQAGMDTLWDFLDVAISPFNTDIVYTSSWGNGVALFSNNEFAELYNASNSILEADNNNFLAVAGLCFDDDNNLWISNSFVTNGLLVKTNAGDWYSFPTATTTGFSPLGDIVIDTWGQKWIALGRGGGILVYNDNYTISDASDDQKELLSTTAGDGNLPSSHVNTIAVDKDGEIWIGTDMGIGVIYSPENVFNNSYSHDAQQIMVEVDGFAQPLFEDEEITVIKVDGSNKKWIGTMRTGVYLLSDDGTEQLAHFTAEDYPLLSNTITDIGINGETGDVFIGTSKGIVSFKGEATEGGETHSDILVYPNPVPENYNGYIAVRGLVANANVKITDIKGNVIYSEIAEGGQIVWNGKNHDGRRAATGVYLVFSTNEDGEQTEVSKIVFIN